ncbi:salicylate synthase [Streptomyces sp. 8N114]|uniref:salicylate synthase n=1 Tax=Streptomyces sp. 8N114 TaxID=3457419 RepID=UPI003FD07B35
MRHQHVLLERQLLFDGDPVATAAALSAETAEPYLLYESGGAVSWAEGEAAVVEVGADTVRLSGRAAPQERSVPAGTHPLATAGQLLDSLAEGGAGVHGWIMFELAHACLGVAPAGRPLARFVLPEREVRLGASGTILRAADIGGLDVLERRLYAAAERAEAPAASRISVDLDENAARYQDGVRAAVRAIRAGELDKVILSRTVRVPGAVDLPATYLAGRRSHEPARSFLLAQGGWEAAGFSPEIVARVGADGTVTAQPLAGTRALTGDRARDAARRAELYRDAKEVYEHAVSVRLAQAELETVCSAGTVRTEEFMAVKERGSVQHLASVLHGRLSPGATRWDALATLFPAVTASGIPKPAAAELIRRTEGEARGLYSGAVVTLDAEGVLDAALVLRAVLRRDGRTWLRAGAGIVGDSTPERELEETREKLRAVSGHLVPAPAPEQPARTRPMATVEAAS